MITLSTLYEYTTYLFQKTPQVFNIGNLRQYNVYDWNTVSKVGHQNVVVMGDVGPVGALAYPLSISFR